MQWQLDLTFTNLQLPAENNENPPPLALQLSEVETRAMTTHSQSVSMVIRLVGAFSDTFWL